MNTTSDWKPERAPECDTEARAANIDTLIVLILLRQGAWESASDGNQHKGIYLKARDNAIGELKWRILEQWHEGDLHCRASQRLCETLDEVRSVMASRAGYEKPLKSPPWPF